MDENPASRNQAILNFIWTRKSGKGIKKEDGNDTYIVFSNRLKDCVPEMVDVDGMDKYIIIIEPDREVWLTHKTDAYFLNSNAKNYFI